MAAAVLLAALLFGPIWADSSGNAGAPVYSAASIANSAAASAGYYAPDTFISIYGTNLSTVVRTISASDVSGGLLPTTLGGVHVLINGIPADIWYVSPTLVNALVPSLLASGAATLQVISNGIAGPAVQIQLGATAPAFFQIDASHVLATHLDGSVVSSSSPAHGGEWIILWTTGMGPTVPAAIPNQVAQIAAPLASPIQILLNGAAVSPSNIDYAGAVVGYAGLYQINLLLPDGIAPNAEIRVATPDQISPAGRFLIVQ
ncbi:MAG TPA: hypothetical protein VKX39_14090 [Bryobacteraceae bacterium]|jgi:uncharacterized protein (TIGR03437 family)|nr:hypothetical protein [Bryobacteraceae bacterium]